MSTAEEMPHRADALHLYKVYYERVRQMPPDFADDLLREALRCYSVAAYTTACIACRVAIEEELKEIYESLINLGDHSTWQPLCVCAHHYSHTHRTTNLTVRISTAALPKTFDSG